MLIRLRDGGGRLCSFMKLGMQYAVMLRADGVRWAAGGWSGNKAPRLTDLL